VLKGKRIERRFCAIGANKRNVLHKNTSLCVGFRRRRRRRRGGILNNSRAVLVCACVSKLVTQRDHRGR
jgi:hypothetical protein